MGNYISELGHSLWKILSQFSDAKNALLLIISLILLFVFPSFLPNKDINMRGIRMRWERFKIFWRNSPYRWIIVLVVIFCWFSSAQYIMYQNQHKQYEIEVTANKAALDQITAIQNQYDLNREYLRPILSLKTDNYTIKRDEQNQKLGILINFQIINTGERPAYHTTTWQYYTTINDIKQLFISYNGVPCSNLIFKGIPYQIIADPEVTYKFQPDETTTKADITILIYTHLEYWYSDNTTESPYTLDDWLSWNSNEDKLTVPNDDSVKLFKQAIDEYNASHN